MPKKLLLNILGFEQLMLKGADESLLESAIVSVFNKNREDNKEDNKETFNNDFLDNYFNKITYDNDVIPFREELWNTSKKRYEALFDNRYKVRTEYTNTVKNSTTGLYKKNKKSLLQKFRSDYNSSLLGGCFSFYQTINKFFYSKFKYTFFR